MAAAKKPAKKAEKKVEAVEPTDAKAVEVTPEPAPTTTKSFFDQEYEVTPEGGHRRKSS